MFPGSKRALSRAHPKTCGRTGGSAPRGASWSARATAPLFSPRPPAYLVIQLYTTPEIPVGRGSCRAGVGSRLDPARREPRPTERILFLAQLFVSRCIVIQLYTTPEIPVGRG